MDLCPKIVPADPGNPLPEVPAVSPLHMIDTSGPPATWWANRSEIDAQVAAAHAGRLAECARNHPLAADLNGRSRRVQSVGICGAGIMGTGIAAANLAAGLTVRIYDASREALDRAAATLRNTVIPPAVAGGHARRTNTSATELLMVCESVVDLATCDLVIETVAENRELKHRIFQQVGSRLRDDVILATNTSTIRLEELAQAIPHPARFCGLHFCNPVEHRPLVEIVRGEQTDPQTIASAIRYVVQIGRIPIVVQDRPGFLVNRILLPYLNEALEMVCHGVDLKRLDAAARRFGMAMGPIELFDLIGVDTAMRAGRTLWEAFPLRTTLTPILPALVKRGRLGQKTGIGFYQYSAAGDGLVAYDPDFQRIIQPYVRRARTFSDEEIVARLILPMLLEATRTMEERVVEKPQDVDIGVLFGLAFPAARGGLLYWADSLGSERVLDLLQHFASIGPRMRPTDLLQSLAATGGTFYGLG